VARPAVFGAEAGAAGGVAGRAEEGAARAALTAAADDVDVRGRLVRGAVERAAVGGIAEEAAGGAAGVGALAVDHVDVRRILVRRAEEWDAVPWAAKARAARAAVGVLAALAAHVDEALAGVSGAEERGKVARAPEVGQPPAVRMPAPLRHQVDVPRSPVAGAQVGGTWASAGRPEQRPLAAVEMRASDGAAEWPGGRCGAPAASRLSAPVTIGICAKSYRKIRG
jgi:hypothetical protein